MLHVVHDREFMALVLEKSSYVEARSEYTAPILSAIVRHWAHVLDPVAVVILFWLVERTISAGKAADQIALREFFEQHEDSPIPPLSMSENTVRKHLKGLTDDDLVHSYSSRSMEKGVETRPRLFEINYKLVFEKANLPATTAALLVKIDRKVAQEVSIEGGVQNLHPSPQGMGGDIFNRYEASSELDKSNLLGAGSALPTQAGNVIMLPIPKKARSAPTRNESVTDVLRRVQTATTQVREGRAASAAAGKLTVANLQAMIDQCG